MVVARRFRSDTVLCGRRIFTERFDDGALAPWARANARARFGRPSLGLALGGRPAASFARRLMLPVSNDFRRPLHNRTVLVIFNGGTRAGWGGPQKAREPHLLWIGLNLPCGEMLAYCNGRC